jgi:apolipoprotein D and lipocalin family protein
MKPTVLALGLLIALTGCSTFRTYEPLPAVDRVDLDRFMGKWYVIASTPTIADRAPYNATETYERADRGIQVTYQFNADSYDGELRTITSRAMINDPGINTSWHTTFAWLFGGDSQIIYLEPDYSVTVVATPDKKRAWIMARQPRISAPQYSDIILYLQELGFNIGKIRMVPHG